VTTPDWFTHAINVPRTFHVIEVDGIDIHFDRWAEIAGAPALVFVHGNGAHSHWWDFIAPAFAADFNVAAMDMSGAGDSGHRQQYSASRFADEIIEVCRALDCDRTYVVGHSFGGSMTRIAAYLHGNELDGVVLVDSGISAGRGQRRPPRQPRGSRRFYPSLSEGKRRFRLRPPQPCKNDYILDYIAGHSLAASDDGYQFKLDQSLFARMTEDPDLDLPDAATLIRSIPCPVGFIYGELSRFFPAPAIELLESIIDENLIVRVDDAHHHIFLDQPLAFIDALRVLLRQLR
jgi:pimeloyl-ACP methyl ester carboxylesterase